MTIKQEIKLAAGKDYRYYVYALLNTKNEIFYIGKGKNNRCFDHLKDANKLRITNQAKHIKIINVGIDKVKINILAYFKDEYKAYQHEEFIIDHIGIDNLTNLSKYGRGKSKEKQLIYQLANIKPFYYWVITFAAHGLKFNQALYKDYWRNVKNLIKQANLQDYKHIIIKRLLTEHTKFFKQQRDLSEYKLVIRHLGYGK